MARVLAGQDPPIDIDLKGLKVALVPSPRSQPMIAQDHPVPVLPVGRRRWLTPVALAIWGIVISAMVLLEVKTAPHRAAEVTRGEALRGISPAQRASLFARRLDDYRALCGAGLPTALVARTCAEDASLLSSFPECDPTCHRSIQADLR